MVLLIVIFLFACNTIIPLETKPTPDINARDSYGNTLLIHAVDNKNIEIVNLLLERGADANAKDNSGKTALDYAEGKARDTTAINYTIRSENLRVRTSLTYALAHHYPMR